MGSMNDVISTEITVSDDVLRQATGLHIDVVRRLVTERVFAPEAAGGGRGRMRLWKLTDFWRAGLVAAFMTSGLSAPVCAPLVRELNDNWLQAAVTDKIDFEIAIYNGLYAFIEAPAAYVSDKQPEGLDYGWRNARLLIADFDPTARTWSGFDNTVWFTRRDRFAALSASASVEEFETASKMYELGARAHATAEDYWFVLRVHLTRVLLAAEQKRHQLTGAMS